MKQMKLQTKLFFAYVGLSIIILMTFSIFFYKYVSNLLIEQELQSLSIQNTYFQNQVEAVLNDMDAVSININYSNLVKSKLDNSFDLDISRDTMNDLASLFVTINGADVKVDQINLYDLNGNTLKVGIKTNTDKVDLKNLAWFQNVLDLNGKKLISIPYNTSALSASSNYSDWYLSLYRTYSNQYNQTVGAVETIKTCKGLFKSITSYQKKNKDAASIYIYSADNQLIYPYNLSAKELVAVPNYYSYLSDRNNYISYQNPFSKIKEYLSYSTSNYSGWTYITVQKESQILTPVNHLLMLLLFFVIVMLAISLFISYFLSRNLVRPITHLKHTIQQFGIDTLGENSLHNSPVTYNEFYELNYSFQRMSEELKISMDELIESREQELKSRSLALQTQINPHFYFNTLSSLIVLTENEQPQEVISMCRYLSQIMRYITDQSVTVVSIRSEIDYIEKYLYCMKVRYQSSLNYTIELEEDMLEIQIPKLLIQPLVENSIKYGTNCLPPWNIKIHGQLTQTHWQIDIIDSGTGFSQNDIEKVEKRINTINSNPGMPEMHIDGMGMMNVYMRWKLYAKDSIIFKYGNTKEGHGIVSIGQKLEKSEEEK